MKEKKEDQLIDFSLFYRNIDEKRYIRLNENTINDLGLQQVCEMLVEDEEERKFLLDNMTCISINYDDIVYRQAIFDDLYKNEELVEKLSNSLLSLKTLSDLQKYRVKQPNEKQNIWILINYLKELEVYIDAIEVLVESFHCCQVCSTGLKQLKELVEDIYNNSGFDILKKDIKELTDDISKIKSLTLGVNLDENLNPTDIVMTSLNEVKFSENISIMDGFMEFARKGAALNNGDFRMVYSMKKVPLTKRDSIMLDLTKRVEKAMSGIVKKCRGRYLCM